MIRHRSKKYLKSVTATLIILLHLLSWNTQICESLPQGAPESVCDTMLPVHGGGIPPANSVPPYRIETSSPIVGQGQTLRVEIVGVPYGLNFGGYMIQARNLNPPYQIVGQFNSSPNAKLMNCENSVNNSATHTSPAKKEQVSLEWQSPVDFLGQIIFNSTVAQDYGNFWVGMQSFPVQVVKREAAPPNTGDPINRPPTSTLPPYRPTQIPASTTEKPIDPVYEGCGFSKTCFGMPDGCVGSESCNVLSTVLVRGNIYEFELRTATNLGSPAYVALGLSDDNKMGDDLVFECVPENGRVNMYSSYTSGLPNYGVTRNGVPQNTARLMQSSVVDGVIYCKVQRDPVTSVNGTTFDLINNKYHILLAAGSSLKENGAGYHDLGRLPSGSPINLAEVQTLAGSSNILIRLHGAFMVTAWIGTTSLGILLARYFKQTWVGSTLCGKDQWFAWHRICMVTTWTLTIAASIMIFVEIGGWSGERNPHAILGSITTFLCFIQPIGALFRPAPSSKSRPIFNWAHWLGGNLAHILSIVTIFFSVQLTKAELPNWMDWILVAFVVFHVGFHLIYSIAGCSSESTSQSMNQFQLNEMQQHHHSHHHQQHHHHHGMRNGMKIERKMDAPYAGFRKGLLGVYVVVLILFVVTFVLLVVLAPIEETFKSIKAKLLE